jgi:hypothetical protein
LQKRAFQAGKAFTVSRAHLHHTAALGIKITLGIDDLQEAPANLQRFHTTLKGAREHAIKNVLEKPFNGSFSHKIVFPG